MWVGTWTLFGHNVASSQCGRNLTKLARFHSRIIGQSLLSYSPLVLFWMLRCATTTFFVLFLLLPQRFCLSQHSSIAGIKIFTKTNAKFVCENSSAKLREILMLSSTKEGLWPKCVQAVKSISTNEFTNCNIKTRNNKSRQRESKIRKT